MFKKQLLCNRWPALSVLSTFMLVGTVASARAQSMPAQNTPQENDTRSTQDRDSRRDEVARFDRFLDDHREIAEQLRKEPSLVDNKKFVKDHPALQTWLQQNPEVHQDLTKHPEVFMHQEANYDRSEQHRQALVNFDHFLDGHRTEAEQIRKNPSIVNDPQYLKDHPDVDNYLKDHQEARAELRNNPDAFMRQENSYDRREDEARADNRNNPGDRDDRERTARNDNDSADRDRDNRDRDNNANARDNDANRDNNVRATRTDQDATRRDNDVNRDARNGRDNRAALANFDQFADSHREAAEQLRKNPSLANNQHFLKNHPEVQTFLQSHPEVREELKNNPNAFMHQENRYDAREDEARNHRPDNELDSRARDYDNRDNRGNDANRDMNRDDRDSAHSSFGKFLGGHSEIAEQLKRDPSLANREDYLHDHPELQQYLNAHPDVRAKLNADPQHFVKSSQEFNAKTPAAKPGTTGSTTTTTTTPKP